MWQLVSNLYDALKSCSLSCTKNHSLTVEAYQFPDCDLISRLAYNYKRANLPGASKNQTVKTLGSLNIQKIKKGSL